jgi:AcrR family transcriptional regulator
MCPRTRKQFEEIRESKKKLIRTSALKLFAREGYYTTSISMIAREAKISKGLIYNYYESKEQLLKEIINKGLEQLEDLIDPNHDGVITDEEMMAMLNMIKEMLKNDRRFWSLYSSILVQPSVLKIVKEEIDKMYLRTEGMMVDYFTRKGYDDPKTEALILGSLLDGIAFHYLYKPKNYPIDKVIERLTELYRNK